MERPIYARVVLKCGIAAIGRAGERRRSDCRTPHSRIKAVLDGDSRAQEGLRCFLPVCANINPSISESDAIEMLAALITRPFRRTFEGYAFTQQSRIPSYAEDAGPAMTSLCEKEPLP